MFVGPAYQPGAALIQRREQAHTSEAAPSRGVGRCGEEAMPLYERFPHNTMPGFRLYPDEGLHLPEAEA